MSCDDLTSAHEAPPAPLPPAAGLAASGRPVAARRQPGSVLRQLELLAQDELRQMLGGRGHTAQGGSIADLVWAGLAWDMGLNGAAIAAAGTPAPLPGYAALADHD
ncbi:hypothetical protein A6R71_05920 [Xanthomonas translucens pv. arrhenatheri]|uniref:Uncharacterized protein n=1 Tax=Xanthomonas graminis pv. arrhenatheri LMG 727 TaxID=1195923 RepID=A0A0K2ZJM2_9XANT|nr:hypothetical protein [Xanthomonas translucens]OAX65931.1 hypothetical protein A6R71_05920 [Xanthomonas translucens pv. arrhenatheri]UKE79385.1 hypothetical protein KM317_09395 [Xanthomonas translucens pv. arrhenatheri]CTP83560.1 hypothetical protein XTALMG727_0671 [Xanthomonas translucens pv. arrhenatheri LMG 727]